MRSLVQIVSSRHPPSRLGGTTDLRIGFELVIASAAHNIGPLRSTARGPALGISTSNPANLQLRRFARRRLAGIGRW